MNLVFVTEARFTKDTNGDVYGDVSFNSESWSRYLRVFDHIYVMARVEVVPGYIPNGNSMASSDKVTFLEIPYYVGPLEYFKKRSLIKKAIQKHVAQHIECSFICRIPGLMGTLVIKELLKNSKKYAVEVVGDPDEVFTRGTIKHPLRAYFRYRIVNALKNNVKNAGAVLYVTRETLQRKYPAAKNAFTTYASNVKLNDERIATYPRKWKQNKETILLSIGSLAQMYKAPDIVMKALKMVSDNNNNGFFRLIWLGDGKYREEMIKLAAELKIGHLVSFPGNVETDEVIQYLKEADVFILASRTEGLPRVIIEAMGEGLPVIGSRVGGIPELLSKEVLVEKNHVEELADKIEQLVKDKEFYEAQAKRNLENVKEYKESILSAKRNEFYKFIKLEL